MISLVKSEFELATFFEITPDLVCIASKDGFLKKVNPAVTDTLGYTKEELFASRISTFIHPDDRPLTHQTREELLKGKALINFVNRYITKSGDIVWLKWTSIYFAENEVVFAIAKNVTETKKAELEVAEKYKQFKSLATNFKTRIEKDKKFLAYELHEELAQLVAVLKIDIDSIANNSAGLPQLVKDRVDHASAVSKLLIKSIQRISFSISPNMLDEIGMNATFEWLCNEFSLMNGIPCLFENKCDETNLPHETIVDLFRICQEALTNITYHAQAANVKVIIEDVDDTTVLTITDDGKGFSPDEKKESPGLISMRERAASINAVLDVFSKPGEGTEIYVIVSKPTVSIGNT
jgi:PAS domain S-box-containing protein